MSESELCPCGLPLHYAKPESERYVRLVIAQLGPTVIVTTPRGAWKVPRHFIGLHGIKARELPALAMRYGWEKVTP